MYAVGKNPALTITIALFVLLAIHGTNGLKCQIGNGEEACDSGKEDGCFKAPCGSASSGVAVTGCYWGNVCDSDIPEKFCQQLTKMSVSDCWTCQGDMCNKGDKPSA